MAAAKTKWEDDGSAPLDELDLVDLAVEVELPARDALRLEIKRVRDPPSIATKITKTNTLWANVWGCAPLVATLVAQFLNDADASASPATVLEIACGCGIPSLVAASQGADVMATDISETALALLRRNAVGVVPPASGAAAAGRGRGGSLETQRLTFMRDPSDAAEALPPRFRRPGLVVCSEAMYLSSMNRPLARWCALLLRGGGVGVVFDAMRPCNEDFDSACADCGLGSVMLEQRLVRSGPITLPGCRVFVVFVPGAEPGAPELPPGAAVVGCAPAAVTPLAGQVATRCRQWLDRWAAAAAEAAEAAGSSGVAYCLE